MHRGCFLLDFFFSWLRQLFKFNVSKDPKYQKAAIFLTFDERYAP